jgi:hypothetical protein
MTKRFMKNLIFYIYLNVLKIFINLFWYQVKVISLDHHAFWHEECHQYLLHNHDGGFWNILDKFLKVFVDDLNVHSLSWEAHLKHFQYVLMKLREINLKFNRSKCEFAKSKLGFWSWSQLRRDTTKLEKSKSYYEFSRP